MSEDKAKQAPASSDQADETPAEDNKAEATSGQSRQPGNSPSGPTFTETPDPLAGIRRWSRDTWDSMEGKTVSMRTYVGTIAAIIILMLLARCGA